MTSETRGSSRSDFLKQAAGAAAVVAGASAGAGVLAAPARAATTDKHTDWIIVDSVNVGQLVSAKGGDYQFEVVVTGLDANGNPDKILGPPTRSTFTIEIGAGMAKPMYDWISASLADPTVRKNGAIITADSNHTELSRRSFTGAQITSFTIPRLVNRPQAFPAMTVTFEADSVSDDAPSPTPVSGAKQKAWLCSNFRFDCPSLPASRVASIDSFTWKRSQTLSGTDLGTLGFVIPPGAVPAWQQWYDNFALAGDTSDERDATLTVWGSTPQLPLFTCTFGGLGIFSFPPPFPGSAAKQKAGAYVSKATWDLATGKGA